MFCPNCGKEINENQKFCSYCGCNVKEIKETKELQETPLPTETQATTYNEEHFETFNQNYPQNFKKNNINDANWSGIIAFIIIAIVVTIFILFAILKNDSNSSSPISNIFKTKAPNCESEEVKNLVLDIYKENDYYYKFIDPSSIDSITLRSPVATAYDSNIDKYSCKGVITLKSANGFRPTEYEYSNGFYNHVQTYNTIDNGVAVIYKEIAMECPVTYSSQLSEGKTAVYSTYCGSGSLFDYNTNPEMTPDKNEKYIEIPGSREKLLQEQKEREERIEREKQQQQEIIKQETSKDAVEEDLF